MAGHVVRWICPAAGVPARPESLPAEVDWLPVASTPPGFGAVQGRLADIPTEARMAGAIRDRLPGLVHVLEFGGDSSVNLPWIAERLGVPAVVNVARAPALCHRGTLVDETGTACERWLDARRCTECCLTPFPGGLTPAQAWRARLRRRLPLPTPYPSDEKFLSRVELVWTGLQAANLILVPEAEDVAALTSLGLPAARIRVVPRPLDAASLEPLYRAASR